jgi:hypothetical protein
MVQSLNNILPVIPAKAGIQKEGSIYAGTCYLPIKSLSGSIAKYHVLSGVGTDDPRKPFKSPFEKGGFRGISKQVLLIKIYISD